MAKKILSIVLAVMMIATLCTVAFISTSAKEAEYLNFTLNNKSYRAEVGGTFTVKKSVVLPDGYSVQGGKFSVSFDTTLATAVAEDGTYTQTDLFIEPVDGMTVDGNAVSVAYAASKYNKKNVLDESSDNFATFTFSVTKAGTMAMEEIFEIGAFKSDAATTIISNFTGGTYNTIVSGAEEVGGATEPTTTATEATTTATEATTAATEATTAATEATTAATEATTVATEADNFLTIIRGNNTYKVKVGDQFTVKKELSLPDGYSIQGGKFTVYFDSTLATPVADEDGLYTKTDLAMEPVDGITAKGDAVSVAFAASKYNKNNVLSGSKNNFATFTFTAKAAGTLTIDEVFDYGVFASANPTDVIEVYVNGQVKDQAIYNAANKDTIISVPQYATEPTTEDTKPVDKTGETSTVVFSLIALMAIAGVAVVIARKKATK